MSERPTPPMIQICGLSRPARILDEALLDEAIRSYPSAELPEQLLGRSMARIREEAAEGRARVPAPRFRLQFLDLALGAFFAGVGGLAGLLVWKSLAILEIGLGANMGTGMGMGIADGGLDLASAAASSSALAEALASMELVWLLPIGGILVLGLASLIALVESMSVPRPHPHQQHARRQRT